MVALGWSQVIIQIGNAIALWGAGMAYEPSYGFISVLTILVAYHLTLLGIYKGAEKFMHRINKEHGSKITPSEPEEEQ
jgi:hypothetical protein